MAVPAHGVLALSAVDTLLVLLVGAVIFVLVVVVAAVVMALLQAVLPRTDSGADAVWNEERRLRGDEAPAPATGDVDDGDGGETDAHAAGAT